MGTALLSIGVRAMAASYASMQTTGHNIANAGVEGYSRQQTLLATAPGQFTGVGFFGRGVDVQSVVRVHDAFLTREAAVSRSLAAMDSVHRDQLQQLELVFRTGEQGIGQSITQFFAAMSDLASRPGDGASREVVLSRAQDMAMRFAEAGSQLTTLQKSVTEELKSSVAAVNSLAAGIAKVNNDIAAARGTGQPANDLLDKRDQLIAQLSDHVQVTTIPADDGTLGVFMGGGQRLVLGAVAERLQLQTDTFDGTRAAVAITEGASTRQLTPESLGGGRITGLLNFQNKDLVAAECMLGQLSRAVAGAVNDQQQRGLNLQPPVGQVPSQALFGFADSTRERVLPAGTNAKDGGGQYIGAISIDVVDPSQLKDTEYELRADPVNAGAWLLRHVPDDGTAAVPVTDGQQVDGFVIHFDATPDAGDRFLLQPVSRASIGMQRLLSDPLDVAAASPLVASGPNTNTGTVAADGLRMTGTPLDVTGTATVTFTGPDPLDATRMLYSWTLNDAGGGAIAGGSGTWAPGQTIPTAPDADINGFALHISGVPATNDTLVVAPTPYPAANNGNALALADLDALTLVGRTQLVDGSLDGGLTFNQSFVAAIADVGVRTQGADSAAAISTARSDQAEQARASKSGVNLDEEAARLIQFQQSYQAAAKVLQIAQSIFSSLLDIAG